MIVSEQPKGKAFSSIVHCPAPWNHGQAQAHAHAVEAAERGADPIRLMALLLIKPPPLRRRPLALPKPMLLQRPRPGTSEPLC